MGSWHKTGCVLCPQNCGLEILVEDGRMTKVRPDKDNPRSQGYVCRKGLNVIYHQYPADRLTQPLKRVGGKFEPIGWAQAIDEITDKLKGLLAEHGPRCLAYMGASAMGGHMEGAFGVGLIRALGSKYMYSSAGQEFSGIWWVNGRNLGKQYLMPLPDEHNAEMMVAWGWNGMQSHQIPRAPVILKEFSKNPEKLLVVVDPRPSETAAIADMHLAVRPGSDALMVKAMIAIIVAEGWEARDYIAAHVEGWEKIRPWFDGFDAKAALEVCGLDYSQVHEFCRLLTTKKWTIHPDLGIYMGRHSALNSYMLNILTAICGRFCVPGGLLLAGMFMPMGSHAEDRDPKTWRTMTTNIAPVAAGSFPPAVMPEEILSDHPQRLRAVMVSACNPLRSYPDTTAYEKAFGALDLLVVNDIVMNETARLAHYVLPCRTFYESWDTTFFPMTYPGVFCQVRQPLVEQPGQCLEASQVFTLIADKMGLVPDIPKELQDAAEGDRLTFGAKLMEWAAQEPRALPAMPYVLAKTLGRVWNSAALAAIWGILMTAPKAFRKNAARAGFEAGMDQGERIFQALLNNPQGLWIGQVDTGDPFADLKTPSGKVELPIPELAEAARGLSAQSESEGLNLPGGYPLILHAGRHMSMNANTMMRNPEWNKGKRACTIAVHPDTAAGLGLADGQQVRATTEAGTEVGELEVTEQVRPGTVIIPHGFGLIYDGEVYGVNVNRLTKTTNRDLVGTPLHRFVPCRIEAA